MSESKKQPAASAGDPMAVAARAADTLQPPAATPLGAQAALTPEQVAELRAQAGKAAEYWDRLLRTAADLENTRKRAARDKQEAIKYANEGLLTKLVSVLDHFDMAQAAAAGQQAETAESLKTGVAMIHNQLKGILREAGLEEIDATQKVFDPTWHEAVSQQETAAVPEGHVVQQLRKGYKLRDRLIRPAGVVVARKPGA